MNNRVVTLLVLFTLLLCVYQPTFSADRTLWQVVKRLADAKSELVDRHSFSKSFRRRRIASVTALIKIIQDENAPRSIRLEAVRLVEEIRAPEAVDTLLIQLTSLTAEKFSPKTFSSVYPCIPALISIGKPASKAVLKELHKPMKKLRRFALAIVLAGVEGRQVGRFMLQQEIVKAKTPAERRNLQLGLKAFLSMTANERTAEELKAEERNRKRKKRP